MDDGVAAVEPDMTVDEALEKEFPRIAWLPPADRRVSPRPGWPNSFKNT